MGEIIPADDILLYYSSASKDTKQVVSTVLKGDACIYANQSGVYVQRISVEQSMNAVIHIVDFMRKEFGNAFAVSVSVALLSELPDWSLDDIVKRLQNIKNKREGGNNGLYNN